MKYIVLPGIVELGRRPRMGAWIEILGMKSGDKTVSSRPRMGAWIEIKRSL